MPCPHSDCAACPEASGCGALFLTEDELSVLRRFAETPFLPLVKMTDGPPLCPTLEGDAQRLAAVLRNRRARASFPWMTGSRLPTSTTAPGSPIPFMAPWP